MSASRIPAADDPPKRPVDIEIEHLASARHALVGCGTTEVAQELRKLSERPIAESTPPGDLGEHGAPTDPLLDVRVPATSIPPADLLRALRYDFGVPLPRSPRVPSTSAEGTPGRDVEPVLYFQEQHETWAQLCALQANLTAERACKEYNGGRAEIEVLCSRLPTLPQVDSWVAARSSWHIVRADGYVDPPKFLAMLAQRQFPCMDQIRHKSEILYSPAPDMYHDIIGHLPMLCNPRFGEYYETFGLAGRGVRHIEQYQMLNRIYWYTMEFGLVDEGDSKPKAVGAALLTGLGELLTSSGDAVRRAPFSIDAVIQSPTEVDRPNDVLYVVACWDELLTAFVDWAKSERLL